MVKPIAGAQVRLLWKNNWVEATTEDDGFFRLEWESSEELLTGWHPVAVQYIKGSDILAEGKGMIYRPPSNQFGCISDIDDTFLISHSSHLFKRLYVLLTRNAHSRKPFEGVVRHYQLLAQAGTNGEQPNPFFYVSSSEWNLYDFITEFCNKNNLPEGIFLLNQMKQFSGILKTGKGKHSAKFMRIARILEAYPQQRFILLGDSSQQDPLIYSSIASHFPKQVHAVYIRDVYQTNKDHVREILTNLEKQGIPCCFFRHSKDAIAHSAKIGLIDKSMALNESVS